VDGAKEDQARSGSEVNMSRKPRIARSGKRQVSPVAEQIALRLRALSGSAGTFAERRAMSAQVMSEVLSALAKEDAAESEAEGAICDSGSRPAGQLK
jgi:hypothetical protein